MQVGGTVKLLEIASLALAIAILAGCATTHTRTARAADRLERRADAFAARSCYEPRDACLASRYLSGARGFADEAREFRRTIDGAGDQQVVLAYERLWRKYHTLRDEVCGLRDRQVQGDLKPLKQAFVDVQRLVKNGYSYADPGLLASGGYVLDPYYNE